MVTLPKALIEKAVSQDPSRTALQDVFYDRAAHAFVASDGKILAVVPAGKIELDEDGQCEATADVEGRVSVAVLKEARAVAKKRTLSKYGPQFQPEVSLNGTAKLPNGAEMPRTENGDGAFPDWRAVLPGHDDKYTLTVALNPELLWTLYQALADPQYRKDTRNAPCVQLEIKREKDGTITHGIRVTASGAEKGAVGVIMPMTVKL